MNKLPGRQLGMAIAVALAIATAAVAQDNARDAKRLVDALQVRPGAVLADIGAGDGELTVPMAKEVGTSGRIYATDLPGAPIERLRAAIGKTGVKNVEILEGDPNRTNLPSECCDGIFIRNVYHHFADPAAMNASLKQSLKPGARLAIMDFEPDHGEAATPAARGTAPTHGVKAATVARELEQAGFEIVSNEQLERRTFLVVAKKK
jgi:ubiquinone/menaquinone biosynthesis C-methylase UbiE